MSKPKGALERDKAGCSVIPSSNQLCHCLMCHLGPSTLPRSPANQIGFFFVRGPITEEMTKIEKPSCSTVQLSMNPIRRYLSFSMSNLVKLRASNCITVPWFDGPFKVRIFWQRPNLAFKGLLRSYRFKKWKPVRQQVKIVTSVWKWLKFLFVHSLSLHHCFYFAS